MNNICPKCGCRVQPGDQFCNTCGSKIEAPIVNNMVNNQQNIPATGKTVGTAIASLVCGLAGLLIFGLPLGIVAISLGTASLNHLKNFPQDKGKGLAIAGLVIGIVDVVLIILSVIITALVS